MPFNIKWSKVLDMNLKLYIKYSKYNELLEISISIYVSIYAKNTQLTTPKKSYLL